MKKSVARIICFTLILCIVLFGLNKVFKVKYGDGIYGLTKFYELDRNSVDVLFLGSSHAFEDYNTGILWDEYGMASYILSGSVQPMWNTYYYLKEALRTQRPEVIVLEGYLVTWEKEYSDDSRIIKNNYGLRWSPDKLNSIMVSSPKERWSDFLLEYSQYHTRYRELSAADFLPNQNNRLYDDWKGFGCNMATTPLDGNDVSSITDREPLYDKTEKYYRMIIELAQSEGIPIVVAISPYAGITEHEQMKYNTASDIANEYGIPFVNYNLLKNDIGLDYTVDAADTDHLNYKGNQKYTRYFGNYLKSNFDISDRRGDEEYLSWDRNCTYVKQMMYNQQLTECTDSNQLPVLLNNPEYWIFVAADGYCDTSSNEIVSDFMKKLGINDEGMQGIWMDQYGCNNIWKTGPGANEQYISTSTHDFCMQRNEKGSNYIVIDNIVYGKVENGVNVVVYDCITDSVVDCFGINIDDNCNILR